MSHKRNEALRHVQHSMHHVIAAGEGSDRAPDSCKFNEHFSNCFWEVDAQPQLRIITNFQSVEQRFGCPDITFLGSVLGDAK